MSQTIDLPTNEGQPHFCVLYTVTPKGKPWTERRRKDFLDPKAALEFLRTRPRGTAAAWCRIGLTTYEPLTTEGSPQ